MMTITVSGENELLTVLTFQSSASWFLLLKRIVKTPNSHKKYWHELRVLSGMEGIPLNTYTTVWEKVDNNVKS